MIMIDIYLKNLKKNRILLNKKKKEEMENMNLKIVGILS